MIKNKNIPTKSNIQVIYNLWLALSTLLILSLATSLGLLLLEPFFADSKPSEYSRESGLAVIIAILFALLFAYAILAFLTKEYFKTALKTLFTTSFLWLFISALSGLLVALLSLQLSALFPPSLGETNTFEIIQSAGFIAQALLLFGTVLIAPLFEEYLFRGLIYDSMRDRFGINIAIFLSAVVFMAFHLIEYHNYWVGLCAIFVLGIFLAIIRERSGSLLNSMICHASYNLSILMLV